MKDVAQQYQEILTSIVRFENGDVSGSMARHGLNYKINYGVSIPVIDELALNYKSDNELASFLWNKDERECKLLSLRLFDISRIENHQIEMVIKGIENIELAEQAAQCFFIKLKNASDLVGNLIRNESEFCMLTGLILISKIAQTDKSIENAYFLNFINQLDTLKLSQKIYQKRGLARAMLQIGKRNETLKNEIILSIDNHFIENKEFKNWLEQEVKYYLIN